MLQLEQIPEDPLDVDAILAELPTLSEQLNRAGSFTGRTNTTFLTASDTEEDDDNTHGAAAVKLEIPDGFRGKYMPKGRKATPATYITGVRRRSVTFSKRKTGFISKIAQLVWLTGANAFCLVQQVPKIVESGDADSIKSEAAVKGAQYAVEIKSASRNNYAYGCKTWRSLFYREEIKELIAKRFDPDAMMNSAVPYVDASNEALAAKTSGPGVTSSPVKRPKKRPSSGSGPDDELSPCDPTRIKVVPLVDHHSAHTDSYCTVSFPNTRRKTSSDNRSVVVFDEDGEEAGEDEESSGHDQEASGKSPKKKKSGTMVFDFITDPDRRSTSFCKRKGGLMHKAMELAGKTRCRMLLVLSYPEQEGGADLFHIYASPDWRKEVLSERFISMFRQAQLIDRPVLDFFAPPRVKQGPVFESEEARIAAERAPSYYNYCLPEFAFQHKISASFFEEKGAQAAEDAYIFFVWRDDGITNKAEKKKKKVKLSPVQDEVVVQPKLETTLLPVPSSESALVEEPALRLNQNLLCGPDLMRELLNSLTITPTAQDTKPAPEQVPVRAEEVSPVAVSTEATPAASTFFHDQGLFAYTAPLEETIVVQVAAPRAPPQPRPTLPPTSQHIEPVARKGVPANTVRVKQESAAGRVGSRQKLERFMFV